jgi:hypothetical protein
MRLLGRAPSVNQEVEKMGRLSDGKCDQKVNNRSRPMIRLKI